VLPPRYTHGECGRLRSSRPATNFASVIADGKANPCAPHDGCRVHANRRARSDVTSGPPELPDSKMASVWMTSSINRPGTSGVSVPSAHTIRQSPCTGTRRDSRSQLPTARRAASANSPSGAARSAARRFELPPDPSLDRRRWCEQESGGRQKMKTWMRVAPCTT